MTPLDAALGNARRGWSVFPCHWQGERRKRPLIERGSQAAITDEAQIRIWWLRWPDALIGVPTGRAIGDPARFWEASQVTRLAYLSSSLNSEGLVGPSAEKFVSLFKFALANKVPEDDIWDVAVEYVETIRESERPLSLVWLLWELVPQAPRDLAYYLIERLPDPRYVAPDLRRELLALTDEHLLFALLDRKEESFRSVRRAVSRSKRLNLDADDKRRIRSLDRPRMVSAALRSLGLPALIAGLAVLYPFVDAKLTSFVAAVAATAALLRTFKLKSASR